MHGTLDGPTFFELFDDTMQAHGLAWCHGYYTKRGMPAWEFRFWCRAVRGC